MFLYTIPAYFVPNLSQFLNFIGATTGTFIAFIFPITFYLKVFHGKISWLQEICLVSILLIAVVCGGVSMVASLKAMILDPQDK
jgi:hypothetical protein